ncbi:MAG: UDP-N-acetylmuramoyl-L-alanine--D-glutamate ligase [Candidatus Desulfofervidus auxilii]|nr:UDP-N-acetylmuramoyl-L-alanine--D-glutamate ligase [Candidatus Desulfofervidus auxilii]
MFEIKDKHFVIIGLGKTGVALTRFLAKKGAKVTISDKAPLKKLSSNLKALEGIDFSLESGEHKEKTFLSADYIILSPGISPSLPLLKKVKINGIPILGELDLVNAFLSVPIIAITGTNGKTTTTIITAEILKNCGKKIWIGGNIGIPLVEVIKEKDLDYIVAEISSFQLEQTSSFHPYIAVCLNVSEDHLDRHFDFKNYLKCKLKIAKWQNENDWFVLEGDNQVLLEAAKGLKSKKVLFGVKKPYYPGAYLDNDKIIVEIFERWEIDIKNIPLFGVHNYKNIMAALTIAQIIKCPFSSTIKAISSFKGLPHRLEWVSSLNGVNFYNDSKATNVGATIAALESLSKPIVLIAGGLGKGQKFDSLRPLVTKKVKALVLIGTSAEDIEKALKGTTMIFKAKDLEEAVKKAFSLAKPNANVLLSPACASFDMFSDYQERGEEFKKIVHAL